MATTAPFMMPEDGWYHIAAVGEFPHRPSGLVQVIDADAVRRIVDTFNETAKVPHFPGILVDFDHASLDVGKPSEAAGWIAKLDQRPDGVWAQIRWSDRGAEAVRGGRYRFISPVWRQDECLNLSGNKVRPTRLINCAVTNDPNIKGLVPLSNSSRPVSAMDDDQRKAFFARMGRGGGRSSGPAMDFSSKRQTDARVAELQRQREQLEALRTTPPDARDFEQVNLRQLRDTMLRAGQDLNTVTATVARAAELNRSKRLDLQALKRQIRKRYADPAARDRALAKELSRFERDHARALRDWEAYNAQIDKQVRRVDARIREEEIVGEENRRGADLRENNAEAREARADEERARREQIAFDKERRRLLERAAKEAAQKERQDARAARENDPARTYRSELVRRRTYWEALRRGDVEQARKIYPEANHDRNTADLESLRPKSGSKLQGAAFENAFGKLKYEAP